MSFLLFSTVVPLCLLSAIRGVAAHGFVHSVNIGGQDFPGWNPFSDPYVVLSYHLGVFLLINLLVDIKVPFQLASFARSKVTDLVSILTTLRQSFKLM